MWDSLSLFRVYDVKQTVLSGEDSFTSANLLHDVADDIIIRGFTQLTTITQLFALPVTQSSIRATVLLFAFFSSFLC